MNQLSSEVDRKNSDNGDSTEADELSPPTKRLCQSSNSKLCFTNSSSSDLVDLLPDDVKENKDECTSCGKQEILLRAFNCPSLHYFCLNCIFNWTKQHIQTQTPPTCLVIDCGYFLKHEDLDDLPITIKDHQILMQLIKTNLDKRSDVNDFRIKCDKCCLYFDQHDLFIHDKQCLGRGITIPCEICYCPVVINDYEEHMLLCTNDDNSALAQFVYKHSQNPHIDEKFIKLFVCSWQRKQRRPIDIYEMIEELNQTNGISNEACDICKTSVQSDEMFFINCSDNHSLCLKCYKQRLENQMNNNEVLTCHQCTYHLQDKDLADAHILNNEEIILFQNYQSKKVFELYNNLYGEETTLNAYIQPQTYEQQQQKNEQIQTNNENTARRICELCLKQHSYGDIFVLNCNCKICYDCFANDINRQRTTTNRLLFCSLCRSPIKHNDLSYLRLAPDEIQSIQSYQQGKLFESEHAMHFNLQKSSQEEDDINHNDDDDFDVLLLNQQHCLPKYWTLPMLTNFSRHTLDPTSIEYKFVVDRFDKSWQNSKSQFGPPVVPKRQASRQRLPVPPQFLHRLSKAQQTLSQASQPTPLVSQAGPSTTLQQMILSSSFASSINNNATSMNNVPPYGNGALLSQAAVYNNNNSNNNNASAINQPIQYQSLATPTYPILTGTNTTVPQTLPMFPSMAYIPQSAYRNPNPLYPPTRGLLSSSMNITPQLAPAQHLRPAAPLPVKPQIVQVERIQNQRWFKQYLAHQCEFRQKLGRHTEQWLFHGCDEQSSKNIEVEWFNRSYAGQHATAFGHGCYFARDSFYSHKYALPDRNGIRRMFLARVLIGNTVQGESTMRVPPPGYDTTGDGHSIFVTYHDSQAYAEYLICYRC